MKIIIRYLEIYIHMQDLRIYDIIKNSITTTANRIFILNKSYGNRILFAQTCTARNSTFRHSSSACRFLSFQHLKPKADGILLVFGIIITSFSFTRFKHTNTPLSFVLRKFWYCIYRRVNLVYIF